MRFIVALLFPSVVFASPLSWKTPMNLDDSNTAVSFEVDSTWHLVEGKTSGVQGGFVIDAEDRLEGEVSVPVEKFDTDRSSRDERLREVMDEPDFKTVTFRVQSATPLCKPDAVSVNGNCDGHINGALTIRDVTKEVDVPYSIKLEGDKYKAVGSFPIQWSEFGVEDPSILIAKVDPTAVISFSISLETTKGT